MGLLNLGPGLTPIQLQEKIDAYCAAAAPAAVPPLPAAGGADAGGDAVAPPRPEIPSGSPILAVNSNYGYISQRGFEHYQKKPGMKVARRGANQPELVGRVKQGYGTCFNSSIELSIRIDHPGVPAGKVYHIKCFSSTGQTQVPGVICADHSDGHVVLMAFVNFLNLVGLDNPVTIIREYPNMLDYKFRINRTSPRILFNLKSLIQYLGVFETTQVIAGASERLEDALEIVAIYKQGKMKEMKEMRKSPISPEMIATVRAALAGWDIVIPPMLVRETKFGGRTSLKFCSTCLRHPKVNFYQLGKVNFLGIESSETCQVLYRFFLELFTRNWSKLVCLQLKTDREFVAEAAEAEAAADTA